MDSSGLWWKHVQSNDSLGMCEAETSNMFLY